jgi:hypothetical protein
MPIPLRGDYDAAMVSARRVAGRSGRLAFVPQIDGPTQHHSDSVPGKVPELNPQENIWQFLRDNCSQIGSSIPSTTSSITAATHVTSL